MTTIVLLENTWAAFAIVMHFESSACEQGVKEVKGYVGGCRHLAGEPLWFRAGLRCKCIISNASGSKVSERFLSMGGVHWRIASLGFFAKTKFELFDC